jgi:hypothetical protein
MDTNDTSRARGPARPPKSPEETVAVEKPQTIEVIVVRPYRPMNDDVLAGLGMATVGVSAKLPAGALVELPIDEAKRGIRGGFLNFPAQEI